MTESNGTSGSLAKDRVRQFGKRGAESAANWLRSLSVSASNSSERMRKRLEPHVDRLPGGWLTALPVLLFVIFYMLPYFFIRSFIYPITPQQLLVMEATVVLMLGVFKPSWCLTLIPFKGISWAENDRVRWTFRIVCYVFVVHLFDGEGFSRWFILGGVAALLGLGAYAWYHKWNRLALQFAAGAFVLLTAVVAEPAYTYKVEEFSIRSADTATTLIGTDLRATSESGMGEVIMNEDDWTLGKFYSREIQDMAQSWKERNIRARAGVVYWHFVIFGNTWRRNLVWIEPASNPPPGRAAKWLRLFNIGDIPDYELMGKKDVASTE